MGEAGSLLTMDAVQFSSVQLLSRVRLFANPMDCSTPGLPVHHQLLEFTQTHVHWVGDAIQPCHPLWSPSPPAFNLSQHQGLFHWVSSPHQVAKLAKALEFLRWSQSSTISGWFGSEPLIWLGRNQLPSNCVVKKPRSPRATTGEDGHPPRDRRWVWDGRRGATCSKAKRRGS